MSYYERIEKLKMNSQAKEGYKWLIANYEAIQRATRKCKTIGDIRKKCLKEIGFSPAIMFSFFKGVSKEDYVKGLEESF